MINAPHRCNSRAFAFAYVFVAPRPRGMLLLYKAEVGGLINRNILSGGDLQQGGHSFLTSLTSGLVAKQLTSNVKMQLALSISLVASMAKRVVDMSSPCTSCNAPRRLK